VLVQPRQRREAVVPAAEDEVVGGGGVLALQGGGEGGPVAPDLHLEGAGGVVRPAVELDDGVARGGAAPPQRVVEGRAHHQLAVLDAVDALVGGLPIGADGGAVEVVRPRRGDRGHLGQVAAGAAGRDRADRGQGYERGEGGEHGGCTGAHGLH